MIVTFGSTTSKQGMRNEYQADAHTADSLRTEAESRGVDTSGTKADIAARLSAVVDFTPLDDPRVTVVNIPEGVSLSEAFVTLTASRGVIANHADDVDWVECESAGLAALLAEHYECAIGAPSDLENTHYTFNGPPGVDMSQEDQ